MCLARRTTKRNSAPPAFPRMWPPPKRPSCPTRVCCQFCQRLPSSILRLPRKLWAHCGWICAICLQGVDVIDGTTGCACACLVGLIRDGCRRLNHPGTCSTMHHHFRVPKKGTVRTEVVWKARLRPRNGASLLFIGCQHTVSTPPFFRIRFTHRVAVSQWDLGRYYVKPYCSSATVAHAMYHPASGCARRKMPNLHCMQSRHVESLMHSDASAAVCMLIT